MNEIFSASNQLDDLLQRVGEKLQISKHNGNLPKKGTLLLENGFPMMRNYLMGQILKFTLKVH